MTAPRVLAIDPSLTASGVAHPGGGTCLWTPGDLRGTDRLSYLHTLCSNILEHVKPDVVVLEGYSYASKNQAHQMGELGAALRLAIWWAKVPCVVIPPAVLKKAATGKGNATKPDMRMALFQRAGVDIRDDNEVDAAWLRHAALVHYGWPEVELPKAQSDVLDKIDWPELAA